MSKQTDWDREQEAQRIYDREHDGRDLVQEEIWAEEAAAREKESIMSMGPRPGDPPETKAYLSQEYRQDNPPPAEECEHTEVDPMEGCTNCGKPYHEVRNVDPDLDMER